MVRSHRTTSESDRNRPARRDAGIRPIVLVLPGILGSELSDTQPDGYGLIWLDPFGILGGQLAELTLKPDGVTDADPAVHVAATGVFASYYGDLVEALQHRGFDARPHYFDWRKDIRRAAAELAQTIEALPPNQPVFLVAHSMGGLVSRTMFRAYPTAAARVHRLIMLGTPNFGSFSPAQVFSGQHELVGWVALADLWDSRDDLIGAFRSFPGLIEMLPNPTKCAIDFFAQDTWPADAFAREMLLRARRLQEQLAEDLPARSRYTLIAGYGNDTVVEATKRQPGDFEFASAETGDGTVPLDLCLLDGIERTYFTRAQHGSMPADDEVIAAVGNLLSGTAVDLPTALPLSGLRAATRRYVCPAPPAEPKFLKRLRRRVERTRAPSSAKQRAAAQRATVRHARATLNAEERRELRQETESSFAAFLARPQRPRAAAKAAPAPLAAPIQARRLLIKTAFGSISDAPSSTLVLGVYPGIRPQSSLKSIDERVNGYITRLFEQGTIHAGAGEVLFLPVPGTAMPAELLVLVGLGEARFFTATTLRRVGENLARALLQLHITEFATVPIGSGSALGVEESLANVLEGLLAGLETCDPDRLFRAITLCEADARRVSQLRTVVANAVGYWARRGVELEVKDLPDLPAPPAAARERRYSELSYWIEQLADGVHYFLLGAAANVETVGRDEHFENRVRALQAAMESRTLTDAQKAAGLHRFGADLARSVPAEMRTPLNRDRGTPTTLNLTHATAAIPWETLATDATPLALQQPVARRLAISADHRPAAGYLLTDGPKRQLRIAIVADPTGNLAGARREGEELTRILGRHPHFEVRTFVGPQQCSEALVRDLMDAGAIDVLHYAGHGYYDPEQPQHSGLLLNGGGDGILTAAEVRAFKRPPLLIFTNACQVGIVGLGSVDPAKPQRRTPAWRQARTRQPFGFAEALLQSGVRSYIGTFWSIPDDAAVTFAAQLYRALAQGRTLGEAMLAARQTTQRAGGDGRWAWASYMLYGPAWLRLG